MTGMSAPGWYPDPAGQPGMRWFDGRSWTNHTANIPQRPAPQPPPSKVGHVWLWVAFGVVVAMILGVSAWLLVTRLSGSEPTAAPPSVTTTAPPATTPTAPTSEPAPTSQPPAPSAEPSSEPPATTPAEPPPAAMPAEGSLLEPLAQCPGSASGAVGEQGPGGDYVSADGLSMPAMTDFVASAVQIPWIDGSNSQTKGQGTDLPSLIVVGTLLPDDGFEDPAASTVRLVQCILGLSGDVPAEVTSASTSRGGEGAGMSVQVPVAGGKDLIMVETRMVSGTLHVWLGTAPYADPAAIDSVIAMLFAASYP